ncbi:rCG54425, partial [Rattus norvegicus]
MASDCTISL